MSASLEGLSELEKGFNEALKKVGIVNDKALHDVALDLLGKAKELAPVDTGDLRGSASMEIENNVATIGFEEPYAVSQHEHTEYEHPQGGQAKYLEQPFKEK
ncbi:MAG: hypothetical protein K0R54_5310 [Clostridiaceae bacterium]|nr:hypothetical protein [Clostridiaceae bacterium]